MPRGPSSIRGSDPERVVYSPVERKRPYGRSGEAFPSSRPDHREGERLSRGSDRTGSGPSARSKRLGDPGSRNPDASGDVRAGGNLAGFEERPKTSAVPRGAARRRCRLLVLPVSWTQPVPAKLRSVAERCQRGRLIHQGPVVRTRACCNGCCGESAVSQWDTHRHRRRCFATAGRWRRGVVGRRSLDMSIRWSAHRLFCGAWPCDAETCDRLHGS